MFEKFSEAARDAVQNAQQHALRAGAREIGPEHLLLALIDRPDGTAGLLLAEHEVRAQDVTAELDRTRRRGGLTDADAEALGELGIDVGRIVAAVERTHGENALVTPRATGRSRFGLSGVPFSTEAKRTLELSLREAVKAGDRRLGSEYLLLALAVQRGPVADVLREHGLGHLEISRALARRAAAG